MKHLLSFKSQLWGLVMALGVCLWSYQAQATHAMGADLTYTCIGSNQYEITLTFYRDCKGTSIKQSQRITLNSLGCKSFTVNLPRVSQTEVTTLCPGAPSACNNRNGSYGVEKHTYRGRVTLPSNGCSDWTASWSLCCRNYAITTLLYRGTMYVSAELGNPSTCNNSPVFLNEPTVIACVGQPVFYNHGAYDADGDQLVYSLGNCYYNSNNPVNYAGGFSATSPMTTTSGVTIDSSTGAISFTPSTQQVGVICVIVEEYRNGQKIGEVVRDMQFTIVNCSNNLPTLSGINGNANYSTNVTAGNQICFSVYSSDFDIGQTTQLSWNQAIPNGSFTSSGSPRAQGEFCWTPTAADVGTHSFTITVQDDACPLVGTNIYTYTIEVFPLCEDLELHSDIHCNWGGTVKTTSIGGTAPHTYRLMNWSTAQVYSNTSGKFFELPNGDYVAWVTDASGCTSSREACFNSFTVDCAADTRPRPSGNGGSGDLKMATGENNVLGTTADISHPSLVLSPNPAGIRVEMRYGNLPTSGASLEVFDPNGKVVHQKRGLATEGSYEIAIESWAPAVYFFVLRDKESKIIKTERLVVE